MSDVLPPLAYPEVYEPVQAILRDSHMSIGDKAKVWRCVEVAFEGARLAGLMVDPLPPAPRRVRRAFLLLRQRKGHDT